MHVPDGTRIGILGRGRWASKVVGMLVGAGVDVVQLGPARREAGEDAGAYEARIATAVREGGCTDVWLCVPPGVHVPVLVRALGREGVGVIVEKPWPYPRTRSI
ncbi:hypothetical protein ACNHYB_14070 [Isoptericola jiangsuensis]|uniref:hypothetical protein n=1 Tax=Isoptericola jiangsuensis TaxID=548579 RepID=UPI003AAE1DB1